jgi:hypothetical protein
MAEYQEKFIVVNGKHLTLQQAAELLLLLEKFKLPDNKYYVCNQDEPYAPQIIKTILDGEDQKANPVENRVIASEQPKGDLANGAVAEENKKLVQERLEYILEQWLPRFEDENHDRYLYIVNTKDIKEVAKIAIEDKIFNDLIKATASL